jgi:DNA polymerase-3 subunit beta
VKLTIPTDSLATALRLAVAALDRKAEIDVFNCLLIKAGLATVTISATALDWSITAPVEGAIVQQAGEVVVSGRLAALVAAFPGKINVEIELQDGTLTVAAARCRYRLATMPVASMPAMLTVEEEVGELELDRGSALDLFARPLFAIVADDSRSYLRGVYLHGADDGTLLSIATDGHRLCKLTVPAPTRLTTDRRLIVPHPAAKLIAKCLGKSKAEAVRLRRGKGLFEIDTGICLFASKLIDSDYPALENLIPALSTNRVECNRADLMRAVGRLAAVADPDAKAGPAAVLSWDGQTAGLHLALAGVTDAEDTIEATPTGSGCTTLALRYLTQLLEEIGGERVVIDSNGRKDPVLFLDPADDRLLMLLAPRVA